MERQPISREGYEKLREEVRVMEEEEMPKITERIKLAREEGDLSENAEYHGARESQGMLQAKINQLKTKLANCYIADKASMPKGVVNFGSLITVKDLSDGMEEKYELVGPGEEVWILPAAWGAVIPCRNVHARACLSPAAVKKVPRSSRW